MSSPKPASVHWLGIARQIIPGPIISVVFVGSGELNVRPKLGAPVPLTFVGAIARRLMWPLLAFKALYFRYGQTDARLHAGYIWTGFLWLAAVSGIAAGVCQVVDELQRRLK